MSNAPLFNLAQADHFVPAEPEQQRLVLTNDSDSDGDTLTVTQFTVGGPTYTAGQTISANGWSFVLDGAPKTGDTFTIGALPVTVMHVPGHTPACLAYAVGEAVFVGDTMFMPDYGTARADFPGGDARTLFRSLRRILSLPPETRLFMCHDYLPKGRTTYVWETTVAAEREGNIHAHDGIAEDEFVAMREARDATLAMPRLIIPSLQVNMRAGKLPPKDESGKRYTIRRSVLQETPGSVCIIDGYGSGQAC